MDKKCFSERLELLLKEVDFKPAVKTEALDYICKNYKYISQTYKAKSKVSPYDELMILIYRMVDLDKIYSEKALPKSVMVETLSDLTLRQKMYFEKYNELGLTEEDKSWLEHIYDLEIFKLGSLQYELAQMTYIDYPDPIKSEKIYKKLPEGSNILKVHIRRGVDLRKEMVDQSFDMSVEFFKTHYPDYNYLAYTCGSWMLYSKNNLLLPATSNILKFAERFELFYEEENKDMAIKYIFGEKYKDLKSYPQETSLQRKALKNLDNLGVGYGVIYKK